MSEENNQDDNPQVDQSAEQKPIEQKPTGQKPSSLVEAAGAGAFGGAAAGLAAHYLAGGKMIFPIFIVAYILILSGLKGWGKLVGLIVFTAVAALVVVLFQYLDPGR
ncbi:MAG: hypothetical protein MUO72_13640 [Bacteroidales bacterium]|nr:hypothetical protein [Bacteroidales bacterium]